MYGASNFNMFNVGILIHINCCMQCKHDTKIKYHSLANYLPWWWLEKYKIGVLGVLCSDA
jgi:hypothetical protein